MAYNLLKIFVVFALVSGSMRTLNADEDSINTHSSAFALDRVTAYTLPNGLKVLLYPDASEPELTVNTVYRTGAKHENPSEYGMAHLLEHLIFKRSRQHSNIPQELEKRGARFNANTNSDRTTYYMTLPVTPDALEFAIALEADRMTGAVLTDAVVQAEFSVIKKEWVQTHGTGFQPLLKAMVQLAYPQHAYGRDTLGFEDGLLTSRRDHLRAFYERRYGPNRAILSLGGRFAVADAKRLIEKYFAAIPSLPFGDEREPSLLPSLVGERQVILPRPGGPGYVGVLYRATPGADRGFVATQALVHCLAGGPHSIVHQALVQGGWAEAAFGFVQQSVGEGFIAFMAQPAQGRDPVQLVHRLSRLLEASSTSCKASDLHLFQKENSSGWAAMLKDSRAVAMQLSEYEVLGDWRLIAMEQQAAPALQLRDLQAAARWIRADRRTAGVLDPRPLTAVAPGLRSGLPPQFLPRQP